MAISVTTVLDAFHLHVADVTATADADQDAVIEHTLAAPPRIVMLLPLRSVAYASRWHLQGEPGATSLTIRKRTTAGANANPQVRVFAWLDVMGPRAP